VKEKDLRRIGSAAIARIVVPIEAEIGLRGGSCGRGAATANKRPKKKSAVRRMESAFAEFVAGEIAEAVVGSVLVELAERGVV